MITLRAESISAASAAATAIFPTLLTNKMIVLGEMISTLENSLLLNIHAPNLFKMIVHTVLYKLTPTAWPDTRCALR